jgi:hypothetical protein
VGRCGRERHVRTELVGFRFRVCLRKQRYVRVTYLVSASSASLTSAATYTGLHGYTITRSDTTHATTDFGSTDPLVPRREKRGDNPPSDTTPDDSWPRTLYTISEGASRRDNRVHHRRLYYIVADATVHKIMHLCKMMHP